MKKYIIDASVILNFLLGQSASIEKKFLETFERVKNKKAKLYSTHLLPLEIGNGLRYSLRDETLADEALRKFFALPIEYFELKTIHFSKILPLSYQFKTSFYDTSYHFLAKLLSGVFITCDASYYRKARKLGNIELF